MFKTFVASAVFLFLVVPAQADTGEPNLKTQIRDAIYADDLDAVEALVNDNQRLFELGERTADDTRRLFTIFDSTNPQAAELAVKWVEAKPQSPYANAAIAWVLDHRSWNIRGSGLAREIYPDALRIFRDLQVRVVHHAEIAYEIEPRLIAASDAIIASANGGGQ